MLNKRHILLIITGGIAAYKCLDLIRRLRDEGAHVRVILTQAGAEFVTPLSVSALSEQKVYSELFSLTEESEMGHIRLAREAELVVVAPATADFLAKMTMGLASDLATTALLAADSPVLVAPAMNRAMWDHAATRRNLETLEARGVMRVGPGIGDLACGETGEGRMAEVEDIIAAIGDYFQGAGTGKAPLKGRRALVTSGPTHEAIDPVRFVANRSSGKQGHAIARAFHRLGADTILVSGPVSQPDPQGVETVHVESAMDMLAACEKALPADVAVCAAAVSDWRPKHPATRKIKKSRLGKGTAPELELVENPDILLRLSEPGNRRPRLVVGFAAETEDVVANGSAKLADKGCDWIVANDVSEAAGTFGSDDNVVHLVTAETVESWPRMTKDAVADRLVRQISATLAQKP